MQSRPTPASLPCGRNGVPMHARAALAILSPVMSKPGIAGKQVVARHMRLTLKIGGIGKAVPAGGKALVAPLPQLDRIARRTGEGGRSEEHTSELQSLMRISYAVF